jgi:hypothetical protein
MMFFAFRKERRGDATDRADARCNNRAVKDKFRKAVTPNVVSRKF